MLIHPQFDPVAVQLGPVAVHWYGIMYLVGFALFLILGRRRAEDAWRGMTKADLEDLLFYGVLGVVLGGRLGFCLFYQPAWFTSHPLDVFKVWQGGMSAHGGMIVNRIAHVRGVWRSCSIPIYEARRPDDPQIGDSLARSFRETGYKPDFAGLVRFFYGRAKDTGLDWEDVEAARQAGTLDALIKKASNR